MAKNKTYQDCERELGRTRRECGLRKQLEEEFRQEHRRLQFVVEGSRLGTWVWDVQTNQTLFNDIWATMLGYTLEELTPYDLTTWQQLVHPDDLPRAEEALKQCAEGVTSQYHAEFRMRHKQGHWVWIMDRGCVMERDADGNPAVMYGTHTDISQIKQAEQAASLSHERLKLVLNNLDATVYIADMQTYEILFVNDYARRQIGHNNMDQPCWQAFQKDLDGPCPFCTNGKLLDSEGNPNGVYRWEFRNTRNGRWYECRDSAIPWVDGRLVRLEIALDITERKQLAAQKLHLQKLESLGRLAGAVAHHYNNLLYVIIGNLQLTLDYMEEGRNPKEEITAALESAHRAAELGHQMLAYLGQRVVRYEQINLRDLLEQNHADLYKELPAQITLDLNLPQQPVPVKSNRELLGQVIHGLFTNAREAIGAKTGSIKITLEIVPAETIETPHRHPVDFEEGDGQFARLSVQDNGSGIPPEMIELIFDPFYSTKFTGRGLGLSVILGAIRNQGGCITVESTPGLGSTFRVYLPLVVEE